VAVLNQHIPAALGIAAIVVRPVAFHGHAPDNNIFGEKRVNQPEGSPNNGNALDQNALALVGLDEWRAESVFFVKHSLLNGYIVVGHLVQPCFSCLAGGMPALGDGSRSAKGKGPPMRCIGLSVQNSVPGDGNIGLFVGVDERTEVVTVESFPTGKNEWGVVRGVGGEPEGTAVSQMQVDIAFQCDGPGVENTFGNDHAASSCRSTGFDGCCDGLGAQGSVSLPGTKTGNQEVLILEFGFLDACDNLSGLIPRVGGQYLSCCPSKGNHKQQ